jgi:hypothetical protein
MRGRTGIFPGKAGRFPRRLDVRRGQVLVLAIVIVFLFFLVAVALIDVYHLLEARNWGYRVAQQAALAGASGSGGNWVVFQPTVDPMAPTATPGEPGCIDPVRIELDPDQAHASAESMLVNEMSARGFVSGDYTYDIRVLWQNDGGTEFGFPPYPVRLGGAAGDWSTANPAVGVYLSFDVHTFMMSVVGRSTVTVRVFAAAEASQPPSCPP